jgi:hypothetical protein
MLESADPDGFDALMLPGGVMNPDHLRMDRQAVEFVRHPSVRLWTQLESRILRGAVQIAAGIEDYTVRPRATSLQTEIVQNSLGVTLGSTFCDEPESRECARSYSGRRSNRVRDL